MIAPQESKRFLRHTLQLAKYATGNRRAGPDQNLRLL